MKVYKSCGLALIIAAGLCGNTYGFSGGVGTQNDPFQISNAQELASLSEYVGEAGADKYFALVQNITFTDADFAVGGSFYNDGKYWLPIGNNESPFKGHLDGANFSVTGLKINRASDTYTGLFGYLDGATVDRLALQFAAGIQTGGEYAGGLAGFAQSVTVSDCSVAGVIYSGNAAGGFFGRATKEIALTNDSFEGTVNVTDNYSDGAGGLIGSHSASIDDTEAIIFTGCQVKGTVQSIYCDTGGLIGAIYYSAEFRAIGCSVDAELGGEGEVGGIAGYIRGRTTDQNYPPVIEIRSCTVEGNFSAAAPANYGSSFVGGLIGWGTSLNLTITDSSSSATISASCPIGWSAAGGLMGVSLGNILTIKNSNATGAVTCECRASQAGWGDVGAYAGGLIGYLSSPYDTVYKPAAPFKIVNCHTTGTVSSKGSSSYGPVRAGGFIGQATGQANQQDLISNCWSEGNVIATSASASASYTLCAGGLIGNSSQAEITDCFAISPVEVSSGIKTSAGALVGNADQSTIQRCHAVGTVSVAGTKEIHAASIAGAGENTTIGSCVGLSPTISISDIELRTIDRIAGTSTNNTFVSNYAIKNMRLEVGNAIISSTDNLNGTSGLGKTKEELALSEPYKTLGWDFTITWKMDEKGYPVLTGKIIEPVAPTITEQPVSQTVSVGESVIFGVVATGTEPLTYQWCKEGTPIEGATQTTYTIRAVSSGDAGSYTVIVTNEIDSVTSNAATLTIDVPVAPSITTQPLSQTVLDGESVIFSVTATGTEPFTYQWAKDGTAIPNATGATYTIRSVNVNDAGSYTVQVSNIAGSVTSGAAVLTVNVLPVAPTITTQPESQTVPAKQSVTFKVTAVGTEPLTYQWAKDGTPIPNATEATYTISAVSMSDAGRYTVTVSNAAGKVESEAAVLAPFEMDAAYFGGILLKGTIGTTFVIEYSDDGKNWQYADEITLSSPAMYWADMTSNGRSKRLYRSKVK